MSLFGNLKKQATDAIKKNPDKVKQGLDKATDFIDKRTGGKYTDKLDKIDQQGGEAIDKQAGRPPQASHGNASTDATGHDQLPGHSA